MNMTVTESDKKLLSFLVAFILAILFIFFVFRPLSDKKRELKKEINEIRQQSAFMDVSVEMSTTEQITRERMTQVLQRFYPMLQSHEAENMVTILMLNHNLKIQNLAITMPEKAVNLKWYQYSDKAQPDVPEEAFNEEEENGQTETEFGVYAARVVCTAEGSKKNLLAFVDDISGNYPAISILSTEWSTVATSVAEVPADVKAGADDAKNEEEEITALEPVSVANTEGSLTVTLEIYMCDQ